MRVSGTMQVGQFEGIVQHCLTTPGVHVIDLPINYAVSAQLQVCAVPQCLCTGRKALFGVFLLGDSTDRRCTTECRLRARQATSAQTICSTGRQHGAP